MIGGAVLTMIIRYNFFVNIANFYNTFVTGIAFNGAGWKVHLPFFHVPTSILILTNPIVLLPLHLLGHLRIHFHLLLLRRDAAPYPRRNQ